MLSDPGSQRNMRAMNLADAAAKQNIRVVIWTTDFNHLNKNHRFNKNHTELFESRSLEIHFLWSPGYRRHIGLMRVLDHIILAINLSWRLTKLSSRDLPDIAVIGFPPIEWAAVAAFYLNKKKIKYAIDVKDQWPVNFERVLSPKLGVFSKILLTPFSLLTKYSIRHASLIVSMTE